jgi:hypothetical protein
MANSQHQFTQLQPRGIRAKDAPGYLGMDRNRFNAEVRPNLTEIRYGKQGVCFDRLDLDAWFDDYKSCNGRPGQPKGERLWDAKERQGSLKGPVSGMSTSKSGEADFAKALDQATSMKQRNT